MVSLGAYVKNSLFLLLSVVVSAFCFEKNPVLSGMGDTSWLKIQTYYGCGMDYCSQILDYSGMTYDFHRHKILMFGGGHATQGWNQVEEFDFDSLAWRQLNKPDNCAFYSNPANGYKGDTIHLPGGLDSLLPDGGTKSSTGEVRPASRHTYDDLDMLHDTCLLIMNAVQEAKFGCMSQTYWDTNAFLHDPYVWVFDPIGVKWKRLSPNAYGYGTGTAVDPETDLDYGKDGNGTRMYAYDWRTQTKTIMSNNCPLGWEICLPMTYHPGRRSFFLFASKNIYEYDIQGRTWTTKNPAGVRPNTYDYQVCYDSTNDVFGFINGGAFHYYSPQTNAWYKNPYDTTRFPKNMHFQHMIYDPVNNVYILVYPSGLQGWTTWAYKFTDHPQNFPGTPANIETREGTGTAGLSLSASPNPFNSRVKISYRFKSGCAATYRIFDLGGRMIFEAGLLPGAQSIHGTIEWNGLDRKGRAMAGGYYLGRLTASNGAMLQHRLMLLR